MRIGVDVSQVVYGTGVSRYTQELVSHLLELDSKNEYVLFGGALRRMYDLQKYLRSVKAKNVRKVAAPLSPTMADFFWNRVHRLKIEKLIGKVDVFHSSDWTEPPSRAFKVTTVHDLTPFKFPHLTPKRVIEVHSQKLAWVKKEVERVIAVSETTKNDLVELDFDPEKIRVIPEAAPDDYKPVSQGVLELVKNKHGIRKNYLLSVGVSNERKNTKRIIDAFKEIKKDVPLQLLLVGEPGINYKSDDDTIFTGHIDGDSLRALYTGASALVYPSLYEGFGLPILESFACRTPVVTSNLGSMSEIGKEAAVLVDPESIDSIVKGVKKVLLNRNEYILKGMKRAKEYSWKKTASETLKVYNEVLQN